VQRRCGELEHLPKISLWARYEKLFPSSSLISEQMRSKFFTFMVKRSELNFFIFFGIMIYIPFGSEVSG